jgi:hypothetical protein
VPDLPGGEWSPLLIGHQWPGSASLAALAASERNRAATAAAHNNYAESLRAVRVGTLASQQGVAADAARQLFQSGEDAALGIAESNEAKRDSYRWAHRYVAELRSALQDIAHVGNSEIRRVLDSQRPLAEKVSAIVGTIAAAQTQANAKAAECSAGVLGALETTLGTTQSGLSAREFTEANGVDLVSAFRSPNQPDLQRQVSTALGVEIPDTGESRGGIRHHSRGIERRCNRDLSGPDRSGSGNGWERADTDSGTHSSRRRRGCSRRRICRPSRTDTARSRCPRGKRHRRRRRGDRRQPWRQRTLGGASGAIAAYRRPATGRPGRAAHR